MERGKSITVFDSATVGRLHSRFLTTIPRPAKSASLIKQLRGFSIVEVMVTLSLLAILAALAIPSYTDSINKRRISSGAEQIVSFLNLTQNEAIKRSRPMVVSYSKTAGGSWCIGARLGATACDCMDAEPTSSLYCAIESTPWMLGNNDVVADQLIQFSVGDGAFVFDPARGLVREKDVGTADDFELGLQAGGGKLQMNIKLVKTGKVSACVPGSSGPIGGFKSCAQDS
jgi:type IV fimbrial biogenesis protein FimT